MRRHSGRATQLAIWMYVQINDSSYHGKNYNANHHTRYGNLTGEDAAGMADTLYRIAHYGDASVKIPHSVGVQEKSVEGDRLTFVIQAENLSGYDGIITGIDGGDSLWLNGEPITLTTDSFTRKPVTEQTGLPYSLKSLPRYSWI